MIIECPYCSTRFRLDDARLKNRRAMLKCSRCQHIFPTPSAARVANPAEDVEDEDEPLPTPPLATTPPPPRRRPPAEVNLSLPFDADEESSETRERHAASDEPFSLGTPARSRRRSRRSDEFDVDEPPEELFDSEGAPPSREEETSNGLAVSVGTVIFFLIVVVSAYAALAVSLRNNPDWAQQLAQNMPFVGSGTRDRLLTRKVVLAKVEGSYEHIKEGKDIFVITGEATNHASVPLSSVQILAKIMDHNGNPMDERLIFCGSRIPVKLLRDLSLGELAVIGRLKPPKTFLLRPGETTDFMVVFTDLPSTIGEFTAQVAIAQRQA